jgi:hypothetical protein
VEKQMNENKPKLPMNNKPKSDLDVAFESLRRKALDAPILKDKLTPEEMNFANHVLQIDYSSNYFITIILIVMLKDKEFFWYLETGMISKQSRKAVSLNLLTKNNRLRLIWLAHQVLGKPQKELPKHTQTAHFFVWNVAFDESDYESLSEEFRKATR